MSIFKLLLFHLLNNLLLIKKPNLYNSFTLLTLHTLHYIATSIVSRTLGRLFLHGVRSGILTPHPQQ